MSKPQSASVSDTPQISPTDFVEAIGAIATIASVAMIFVILVACALAAFALRFVIRRAFRSMRSDQIRSAHPLSLLGTSASSQESYGQQVFRASWGLKLQMVVLLIGTLWVSVRLDPIHLGGSLQGIEPYIYPAIFLALLLFAIHVWSYEITIEDRVLTVSSMLVSHREYRLADLTQITTKRDGFLRLSFADGRKVLLFATVAGASDLRQILRESLSVAGVAHAGVARG